MIPINIPQHTRCTNCGECCGPVPITKDEVEKISDYMKEHELPREVVSRSHKMLECVFRDSRKKRCSIYPVRPLVCRLFGVASGMTCLNGNTADIDFRQYVASSAIEYVGIQNNIFGGNEA